MKIAVITIHSVLNFGAIFQAYATYSVLSDFGDTELINYQSNYLRKNHSLFRLRLSRRLLKETIIDTLIIFNKISQKIKFQKFQKKYISLTGKVSEKNFNIKKYDIYVCGSDQIWNPTIISGNKVINWKYFLDFAPNHARKISYASSLGNYRFDHEQETKVKKQLNSFQAISVRENDGKEYLDTLLDQQVEHVLDPTLLLTREDWVERLNLDIQTENENYILVYSISNSLLLKEAIDYFSKKMNLTVISINNGFRKFGAIDKQIRNAGPEDFLKLFLNAKFIITDSFHGVCFSINFKKQFVAISSGKISNRIQSILTLTSLTQQFAKNKKDFPYILEIKRGKYKQSSTALAIQRNKSLSYLKRALKS